MMNDKFALESGYNVVGRVYHKGGDRRRKHHYVKFWGGVQWGLIRNPFFKKAGEKSNNSSQGSVPAYNIFRDNEKVGIALLHKHKEGSGREGYYLHILKFRAKPTLRASRGIAGKERSYYVFDVGKKGHPDNDSKVYYKAFQKSFY